MKVSFCHCFARSTHQILRDGSSGRMKMCVSLQLRAFKILEMPVSLQWRAQKCMKHVRDARGSLRHTKKIILRLFWTSDNHEITKWLLAKLTTYVSPQFWTSDDREMTKGLLGEVDTLRFATVLGVDREMMKGLLGRTSKFGFRDSFWAPTIIKRRDACRPCCRAGPTPDKKNKISRGDDFSKSSLSQQPSSAACLSSLFQQPSNQAAQQRWSPCFGAS